MRDYALYALLLIVGINIIVIEDTLLQVIMALFGNCGRYLVTNSHKYVAETMNNYNINEVHPPPLLT